VYGSYAAILVKMIHKIEENLKREEYIDEN
jgi:hypothetical protein